jgi:aryl-alcohol dehydrogenase-like predicted oxidoreductase
MAEVNSRREFLKRSTAQAAIGFAIASAQPQALQNVEWRNRQPGMSYRRLGRTGLMISEIVSGGDPIGSTNYQHLNLAIEMGLNYLDMAPAYGKGDCEIAYGKLLSGSSKRDKVFLQTKVSAFLNLRYRMYQNIFDGLAADKQNAIKKKADELHVSNLAEKPGYYLDYFPGQRKQFPPAYLGAAMMPDYAHLVEGSQEFRKCIIDSLDGSLKRIGTDHFDLLMCPHGAALPLELENPHIYETFQDLKKQGKVRFLGVTSHNDAAGVLRKATQLGHYDAVMMAYNVINGGYVEQAIIDASSKDVGIIAMKTAHSVATHHKELQPLPQWRTDKLNRIIPGDMKPPMKAYLWVLQNKHIAAVNSNLWDETFVRENLSLAGKTVELQPA